MVGGCCRLAAGRARRARDGCCRGRVAFDPAVLGRRLDERRAQCADRHTRRAPRGGSGQSSTVDAVVGSGSLLAGWAGGLGSVRDDRLSRFAQPRGCLLVGLRCARDLQHAAPPGALAPGPGRRRGRDAAGDRRRRGAGLRGSLARRLGLDARPGAQAVGAGLPGSVRLRRSAHGPGDDRRLPERCPVARASGDARRDGRPGSHVQRVEH